MSSKAQGLSLNTIVIAAIVLVVLLILVGLTTGYFSKWRTNFGKVSDTSCKGSVVDESAACSTGEKEYFAADVPAGKKCCMNVGCDNLKGTCCKDCAEGGSYPDGKTQCGAQTCCVNGCA